jgi:two-component system, OmpR family, phosphate regulon sensor histidine kinase PhoR
MAFASRILGASLLAVLALALLSGPFGTTMPALAAGFGLGVLATVALRRTAPGDAASPAVEAADSLDPGLAAIFDAFDEPLLRIDHGRVRRANRAARLLLGDHVEGEDIRLAIRHPEATSAIAAGDAQPIAIDDLGQRDRRFELSALRLPDGSRLIRLADRSADRATERMRVDFVANASHELRTPLATLLGFIETLEDREAGGDAATRARFLRIMAHEARRMQQLVDDLMSLSRIEVDRFAAPSQPVSLGTLAAETSGIIASAQHLGPDRILVENADDAVVAGDRAQLSQLLHNLIGNALKYGRPGSPVRVVVRGNADEVCLRVIDEGEGIPPDHLPRITERFYRVDPGRSRSLGGTGLGLAIVKHIVERHRGRLAIQSTPGVGTTVSVRLPRVEGKAAGSPPGGR